MRGVLTKTGHEKWVILRTSSDGLSDYTLKSIGSNVHKETQPC